MHPSTLRRFNMMDSRNHKNTQAMIQHLLYYAESRFWCILKSIKKGEDKWCQKLLHRELVMEIL
jgi:hypothetical protein